METPFSDSSAVFFLSEQESVIIHARHNKIHVELFFIVFIGLFILNYLTYNFLYIVCKFVSCLPNLDKNI